MEWKIHHFHRGSVDNVVVLVCAMNLFQRRNEKKDIQSKNIREFNDIERERREKKQKIIIDF